MPTGPSDRCIFGVFLKITFLIIQLWKKSLSLASSWVIGSNGCTVSCWNWSHTLEILRWILFWSGRTQLTCSLVAGSAVSEFFSRATFRDILNAAACAIRTIKRVTSFFLRLLSWWGRFLYAPPTIFLWRAPPSRSARRPMRASGRVVASVARRAFDPVYLHDGDIEPPEEA